MQKDYKLQSLRVARYIFQSAPPFGHPSFQKEGNWSHRSALLLFCFSAILLFCSSALMAQKATIDNVAMNPTNVTVTYTLTTTDPVDLVLCYSLDGKCTWTDAEHVSGTVTCQTAGGGKVLVWDNIAEGKQYGIFYFKIRTEPCAFSCMSNTFPTTSHTPAIDQQVSVPIKVSTTKDVAGNYVHEQAAGPTETINLKFLTYNLGANPNLSPKEQMKQVYAADQTDIRVYGGFYQWGRKDATHTFRCAPTPAVGTDPRFTTALVTNTGVPNATVASDPGKFVYGMASPWNWTTPAQNNSNLWGNSFEVTTGGNASVTKRPDDPCPAGYRVPTEHEWALLGWEDGSSITATVNDGISSITNDITVTKSGLVWVRVVNGLINGSWSANNMCGYAIYEKSVWDAAYLSPPPAGTDLTTPAAPNPLLFLPAAGFRNCNTGNIDNVGTRGDYWSSTVVSSYSNRLYISSSFVTAYGNNTRAVGSSVRCVANDFTQPDPVGASICPGTTHTFTLAVPSGVMGTLSYLWEESADNITWGPATGTRTNANYTTPALSSNVYYRRSATCDQGTITSASALVEAASCLANTYPPTTSAVTVPVKVSTTPDAAGNWVHEQAAGPTKNIDFKFLTYNLGADPALTAKEQMKQKYACDGDLRVYGGFYQWGRKDATHTFRCAPTPAVGTDPRFTTTLVANTGVPNATVASDPGRFVYGMASPWNWTTPAQNNSNLWGNSLGITTGGNTNVTKRPDDPCPAGYRVPTEHEWALLGWEGGNSTTDAFDYLASLSNNVTVAKSGLVWVRVRNGLINGSWAANNMCGYAIYDKSVWDVAYPISPADGTDLTAASAPTPLLFLPAAGLRHFSNGALSNVGTEGGYWGSTVNSFDSYSFYFSSSSVLADNTSGRAFGFSVRCIENYFTQPDPVGAGICSGTTHTFTLGGAFGAEGTLTYLWQQSTDNVTWIPAAGTNNNANYTTPALSSNMYYRRQATCSKGTITTAAALVEAGVVCMTNRYPFTTTSVDIPITVSTTPDAAGNWVHEQSAEPTTTTTLRFLTYNLGADPSLTPKEQMKADYIACGTGDIRVFGGFYQWGRKDPQHTLRCATASYPQYFSVSNPSPYSVTTYNPERDTLFVYHAFLPTGFWAQNDLNNSNLWGNGCSVGSGCPNAAAAAGGNACPTTGTACYGGNASVSKRPNDPCPAGYRVPTQHEWALLGWEDGSSIVATDDHLTVLGSVTETVSRSGLVWVKVNNGVPSTTFDNNRMCGYALYTQAEWGSGKPKTDLTAAGAPEPLMFLPAAGNRSWTNGNLVSVATYGHYWSSTADGQMAKYLYFCNTFVYADANSNRASGYSVRCVAE